ncbi:MAG: hypothetical protein Q8L30_01625 [bacterium]|nr:hypothetical protein [bacterium]
MPTISLYAQKSLSDFKDNVLLVRRSPSTLFSILIPPSYDLFGNYAIEMFHVFYFGAGGEA